MLERIAAAADKFHALIHASADKISFADVVAIAVHPPALANNQKNGRRGADHQPVFANHIGDFQKPFAGAVFGAGAKFKQKIPIGITHG